MTNVSSITIAKKLPDGTIQRVTLTHKPKAEK